MNYVFYLGKNYHPKGKKEATQGKKRFYQGNFVFYPYAKNAEGLFG